MTQMGGVRFAPSPTGRFHLGNLRTAWISWKIAKKLGLRWVVRFEDIDQPRVVQGAQEEQLSDLRALGMEPDEVIVQSSRRARHWELFLKAREEGVIYPCVCSRKEIQSALDGMASAPHIALGSAPPQYSGKCRLHSPAQWSAHAMLGWRFRSEDPSGAQDFIVARTAGSVAPESFVPSYHWACAIDDEDGKYDLLVRAADLSSATAIQRRVQVWMAGGEKQARLPAVYHTSLVVQDDGHRLEKRTMGVTLKELQSKGWTIERILGAFESSWSSEHLESLKSGLKPGIILSEPKISLFLKDLGFSS
jgi:glutamyl-tRNA synthetase